MPDQIMAAPRRLAAILAADIAGYSALVSTDEEGTVRALKGHQAVVLPLVSQHSGRVIDTAGDGIMAEFSSVLNALKCALTIQAVMAERNADVPHSCKLQFRIGINLGDVIFDKSRIYGDGINVAARLEGLADAGGICVSANVHEHSLGKVACTFDDLGEQTLKNIARPVRVYRVRLKSAAKPTMEHGMLMLPDKPSIAVLPFTNMSGDPEQEYFADGIAEDVLTALSRQRWLFVTARNSSFTFRGKAIEAKQVSRDLGVRYILEGSVRRAGSRVRVSAQLVDAPAAVQVWAERYDRDLADIFSVQAEITDAVTIAIAPVIVEAERQRAVRKPPENLSAWEAYHRGMWHMAKHEAGEIVLARSYFQKAIEFDPNFSQALTALAANHAMGAAMFSLESLEEACKSAEPLVRRAISLDAGDAEARAQLALTYFLKGDVDGAIQETDLALAINPGSSHAMGIRGAALVFAGRTREGREYLSKFFVLSPRDPFVPVRLGHFAVSLYRDKNYEDAISTLRQLVRQYPQNPVGHVYLAASLGQLGVAQARDSLQVLFALYPDRRSMPRRPFVKPEDHEHLLEGLRKAGWQDAGNVSTSLSGDGA